MENENYTVLFNRKMKEGNISKYAIFKHSKMDYGTVKRVLEGKESSIKSIRKVAQALGLTKFTVLV